MSAASTVSMRQLPLHTLPVRIDSGRFTFLAYRSDSALARGLLDQALRIDSFPGLPRPRASVVVAVAPDYERFREWAGPYTPEWGAAVAFPRSGLLIIQGRRGRGDSGDPAVVLRHELAHMALFEFLGEAPPRWFDEGYASYVAGEWGRATGLAANLLLLYRGVPSLDSLDRGFQWSSRLANATYALSHIAVADLAALDRERGLSLFFSYWRDSGSMDQAVRSAYGLTLANFEERWRRSVKRRYGLVAVVTDAGVIVGALFFLLVPLFVRRKRRERDRLTGLREAEAAMERRLVTDALNRLLDRPQS